MMQRFVNELIILMKKYGIKEIKPSNMSAEINAEGEGAMHDFTIVGMPETKKEGQ